jgi:hypothetical protein
MPPQCSEARTNSRAGPTQHRGPRSAAFRCIGGPSSLRRVSTGASSQPWHQAVALPPRGGATRLRVGNGELVLEAVRGGHSLLWSDGQKARRYMLGLRRGEPLCLRWRVPRLPLRCMLREAIALAPGGRLHGYIWLPLVPTLERALATPDARILVELLPPELAAEWHEASGHAFQFASPWFVRFPPRTGEPRAVVPLRLANPTADVVSPPFLPVVVDDDELHAMRDSVVVRPRRCRWQADGLVAQPRQAVA